MRPINKGDWPKIKSGRKNKIFTDWKRAKKDLVERTGDYCHFCEMRVTNALAIEHIFPREHFTKQSGNWVNFLLICNYCNGHKSDGLLKYPYHKKYFWPHFNNTMLVFEPAISGIVKLKNNLNKEHKIRGQNLIDLYGLDKKVTSTGDSDTRLIERLTAIKMAIDRKRELAKGVATIQCVVDMAKTTGFFSVWYQIFIKNPDIIDALVNESAFKLSGTNCFDSDNKLTSRTVQNL
ncbi:MAG: hypothetical protein ACJAWV_000901 [Flammeovirgaceae bacterium]|jgi:hypothetical protein